MNEHKNIITIEDEIKEFSDKPVKSSALYKKAKELESNAVPDASEASVGDVLTKREDGIGWSAPSGGAGGILRVGFNGTALDKTWQEISDCFANGGYACVVYSPIPSVTYAMPILAIGSIDGYSVAAIMFDQDDGVIPLNFLCSSSDGYPAVDDSADT